MDGSHSGGRRDRRLRATHVGIAIGAIVWVMVAAWLLRTSVPRGLDLATVDVPATFGVGVVRKARDFERLLLVLWACSKLALVGALWLYARRGVVLLRESAAGPTGSGMMLGMLGVALAWAVQMPFGLVALWWARRHGISHVGYRVWLPGALLTLAVSFTIVCLTLLILMSLARFLGERWWIPGAAVITVIAFAFALVSPLVARTHPPADPALVATYDRLAALEGVRDVPLVVKTVSGSTSRANASAVGIGPTKRIVVWDTLLDGRFTDRELEVVLAHELGHQAGRHVDKAIVWVALFAAPGMWLLMRVTRRRGGMARAEAVPVALLAAACFMLATTPLQNAVSRRIEADADWRALRTTRDPAAARGLFRRLAATSLGDPSPPTWVYVLLEGHPTLAQRVGMADAWEKRATP